VAAISVGGWGEVQREIEGVVSGEGLSLSPVRVWGLAPGKILKFTSKQMQISAYLK